MTESGKHTFGGLDRRRKLPRAVTFVLRRLGGPALAGFLALMLLLVNAMAASPALHRAIHHDADADDHECAVTLFIKGQVSAAVIVTVAAGLLAVFGVVVLLTDTPLFPAVEYSFSSSRAPPFSSFSR
jgi:succinate dehydrogenase/fumarate reductase cytochrome b subunit